MDLALSTSWNAFRHNNGKELIFEIKSLGFDAVELSFNITSEMVNSIKEEVSRKAIRVTSIHNYCPIPDGFRREEALPDCYSMSSLNAEERRLAVKYAKLSIDAASSLGAGVLVLHCGRVEMPDATRELAGLLIRGEQTGEHFKRLRDSFIQERAKRCKPFLDNTLSSLDELNRYAQDRDIDLGIENRFYFREIPNFKEVGIILDKLKGSRIHYWHDTGHAQLMDKLGLASHREYLKSFSDRMIGMHLHDISGITDHLPPGKGELDFSIFLKYLPKDALTVMEAHHPALAQDLVASKKFLEGLSYGR